MKLARSLAPATAAAASPAPADEERRRTIREWVNIQRSRLVDELAQANCPWAEIDLDILNDLLALLQAPPAPPRPAKVSMEDIRKLCAQLNTWHNKEDCIVDFLVYYGHAVSEDNEEGK